MAKRKTDKAKPPEANVNCSVPKELRDRLDRIVAASGSKIRFHVANALRMYLPVAEKKLDASGDYLRD